MMAQMAVAMPRVLAGEQGLFHLPEPGEVRFQAISREDNETDWPFSVDEGMLACVWSGGRKVVFGGRHWRRDPIAARYRATLAKLAAA